MRIPQEYWYSGGSTGTLYLSTGYVTVRCENVWLLGLINCDNLVADCLVARHSASQERSANNQVIRSLDD